MERSNQILYHGVLAANSAWRANVVPKGQVAEREPRPKLVPPGTIPKPTFPPRLGWADLLLRVFGDDGFRCPTCAMPMRIRSVVTDPIVARRILAGFTRAQARGPPPTSPEGEDRAART